VLKSKGTSLSGSDNDDNVFVPYTIAMKRLVGQQTNLRRVNVQAVNADALPEWKRRSPNCSASDTALDRRGR